MQHGSLSTANDWKYCNLAVYHRNKILSGLAKCEVDSDSIQFLCWPQNTNTQQEKQVHLHKCSQGDSEMLPGLFYSPFKKQFFDQKKTHLASANIFLITCWETDMIMARIFQITDFVLYQEVDNYEIMFNILIHVHLVSYICVSEPGQHWFR